MAKVKTGFKNLSVPNQIERTRWIITCMTGNSSFLSPIPTLGVIAGAVNRLEIAYIKSRGRDKTKMEIMRLRRKEVLQLVIQLAAYIQNTSAGDEKIILSSGFDLAKQGTSMPAVTKVLNVRATRGNNTGAIKVNWNPVKSAKVYVVRALASTDAPEVLGIKAFPSAARCELTDLIPGIRYRIIVAAIGGGILGDWSDPHLKLRNRELNVESDLT